VVYFETSSGDFEVEGALAIAQKQPEKRLMDRVFQL